MHRLWTLRCVAQISFDSPKFARARHYYLLRNFKSWGGLRCAKSINPSFAKSVNWSKTPRKQRTQTA